MTTDSIAEFESNDALLNLADVTVSYEIENFRILALDGVNFRVNSGGHTIGVVGESGSGKTTLGMTIMKLIEPPGNIDKGSVDYRGKNVLTMSESELRKYRWKEVAMIYQSAMNSLNPVKRIYDPLIEVLREHLHESKSDARERARRLLSEVGIDPERFDAYPHELSGGMRQRVVVALALALSPKLLIADEPTSALDVVVQRQILSLLKNEISKNSLSLIFITHEISLLRGLVQDTAVMYRGEIVELGPTDAIFSEPLHPYTEMLLETLVTMKTSKRVLDEPKKQQSMMALASNSCKYVVNCKYAFEKCKVERPKLIEVKPGRWVSCHRYQ